MNVIRVRTTKNGQKIRDITNYASVDTAASEFYKAVGNAISDSNIIEISAMLADDNLSTVDYKHWAAEVEPVVEE